MASFNWEWVDPTFFVVFFSMTHPLVPKIIDVAAPIAHDLGLEVVGAVFQTNQSPPVMRVDIRNLQEDTGVDDCERMSIALAEKLDSVELIPDAYVLEISSPGISKFLSSDREFQTFKGFPIAVQTTETYKGKTEWTGKLISRDETAVYLNQKGRKVSIPRELIAKVELSEEQ